MLFRFPRGIFIRMVLIVVVSFVPLLRVGESAAGSNQVKLSEILSGKRLLVEHKHYKNSPTNFAMSVVCDLVRDQLGATCINILGKDSWLLERNGISVAQFIKAQDDFGIFGKRSEIYERGIALLGTDYYMTAGVVTYQPVLGLYWEASLQVIIRSTSSPKQKLADVVAAGGEWGIGAEGNWQKAMRKAAKRVVKDLENTRVPGRLQRGPDESGPGPS
jgi:hypothetical protein